MDFYRYLDDGGLIGSSYIIAMYLLNIHMLLLQTFLCAVLCRRQHMMTVIGTAEYWRAIRNNLNNNHPYDEDEEEDVVDIEVEEEDVVDIEVEEEEEDVVDIEVEDEEVDNDFFGCDIGDFFYYPSYDDDNDNIIEFICTDIFCNYGFNDNSHNNDNNNNDSITNEFKNNNNINSYNNDNNNSKRIEFNINNNNNKTSFKSNNKENGKKTNLLNSKYEYSGHPNSIVNRGPLVGRELLDMFNDNLEMSRNEKTGETRKINDWRLRNENGGFTEGINEKNSFNVNFGENSDKNNFKETCLDNKNEKNELEERKIVAISKMSLTHVEDEREERDELKYEEFIEDIEECEVVGKKYFENEIISESGNGKGRELLTGNSSLSYVLKETFKNKTLDGSHRLHKTCPSNKFSYSNFRKDEEYSEHEASDTKPSYTDMFETCSSDFYSECENDFGEDLKNPKSSHSERKLSIQNSELKTEVSRKSKSCTHQTANKTTLNPNKKDSSNDIDPTKIEEMFERSDQASDASLHPNLRLVLMMYAQKVKEIQSNTFLTKGICKSILKTVNGFESKMEDRENSYGVVSWDKHGHKYVNSMDRKPRVENKLVGKQNSSNGFVEYLSDEEQGAEAKWSSGLGVGVDGNGISNWEVKNSCMDNVKESYHCYNMNSNEKDDDSTGGNDDDSSNCGYDIPHKINHVTYHSHCPDAVGHLGGWDENVSDVGNDDESISYDGTRKWSQNNIEIEGSLEGASERDVESSCEELSGTGSARTGLSSLSIVNFSESEKFIEDRECGSKNVLIKDRTFRDKIKFVKVVNTNGSCLSISSEEDIYETENRYDQGGKGEDNSGYEGDSDDEKVIENYCELSGKERNEDVADDLSVSSLEEKYEGNDYGVNIYSSCGDDFYIEDVSNRYNENLNESEFSSPFQNNLSSPTSPGFYRSCCNNQKRSCGFNAQCQNNRWNYSMGKHDIRLNGKNRNNLSKNNHNGSNYVFTKGSFRKRVPVYKKERDLKWMDGSNNFKSSNDSLGDRESGYRAFELKHEKSLKKDKNSFEKSKSGWDGSNDQKDAMRFFVNNENDSIKKRILFHENAMNHSGFLSNFVSSISNAPSNNYCSHPKFHGMDDESHFTFKSTENMDQTKDAKILKITSDNNNVSINEQYVVGEKPEERKEIDEPKTTNQNLIRKSNKNADFKRPTENSGPQNSKMCIRKKCGGNYKALFSSLMIPTRDHCVSLIRVFKGIGHKQNENPFGKLTGHKFLKSNDSINNKVETFKKLKNLDSLVSFNQIWGLRNLLQMVGKNDNPDDPRVPNRNQKQSFRFLTKREYNSRTTCSCIRNRCRLYSRRASKSIRATKSNFKKETSLSVGTRLLRGTDHHDSLRARRNNKLVIQKCNNRTELSEKGVKLFGVQTNKKEFISNLMIHFVDPLREISSHQSNIQFEDIDGKDRDWKDKKLNRVELKGSDEVENGNGNDEAAKKNEARNIGIKYQSEKKVSFEKDFINDKKKDKVCRDPELAKSASLYQIKQGEGLEVGNKIKTGVLEAENEGKECGDCGSAMLEESKTQEVSQQIVKTSKRISEQSLHLFIDEEVKQNCEKLTKYKLDLSNIKGLTIDSTMAKEYAFEINLQNLWVIKGNKKSLDLVKNAIDIKERNMLKRISSKSLLGYLEICMMDSSKGIVSRKEKRCERNIENLIPTENLNNNVQEASEDKKSKDRKRGYKVFDNSKLNLFCKKRKYKNALIFNPKNTESEMSKKVENNIDKVPTYLNLSKDTKVNLKSPVRHAKAKTPMETYLEFVEKINKVGKVQYIGSLEVKNILKSVSQNNKTIEKRKENEAGNSRFEGDFNERIVQLEQFKDNYLNHHKICNESSHIDFIKCLGAKKKSTKCTTKSTIIGHLKPTFLDFHNDNKLYILDKKEAEDHINLKEIPSNSICKAVNQKENNDEGESKRNNSEPRLNGKSKFSKSWSRVTKSMVAKGSKEFTSFSKKAKNTKSTALKYHLLLDESLQVLYQSIEKKLKLYQDVVDAFPEKTSSLGSAGKSNNLRKNLSSSGIHLFRKQSKLGKFSIEKKHRRDVKNEKNCCSIPSVGSCVIIKYPEEYCPSNKLPCQSPTIDIGDKLQTANEAIPETTVCPISLGFNSVNKMEGVSLKKAEESKEDLINEDWETNKSKSMGISRGPEEMPCQIHDYHNPSPPPSKQTQTSFSIKCPWHRSLHPMVPKTSRKEEICSKSRWERLDFKEAEPAINHSILKSNKNIEQSRFVDSNGAKKLKDRRVKKCLNSKSDFILDRFMNFHDDVEKFLDRKRRIGKLDQEELKIIEKELNMKTTNSIKKETLIKISKDKTDILKNRKKANEKPIDLLKEGFDKLGSPMFMRENLDEYCHTGQKPMLERTFTIEKQPIKDRSKRKEGKEEEERKKGGKEEEERKKRGTEEEKRKKGEEINQNTSNYVCEGSSATVDESNKTDDCGPESDAVVEVALGKAQMRQTSPLSDLLAYKEPTSNNNEDSKTLFVEQEEYNLKTRLEDCEEDQLDPSFQLKHDKDSARARSENKVDEQNIEKVLKSNSCLSYSRYESDEIPSSIFDKNGSIDRKRSSGKQKQKRNKKHEKKSDKEKARSTNREVIKKQETTKKPSKNHKGILKVETYVLEYAAIVQDSKLQKNQKARHQGSEMWTHEAKVDRTSDNCFRSNHLSTTFEGPNPWNQIPFHPNSSSFKPNKLSSLKITQPLKVGFQTKYQTSSSHQTFNFPTTQHSTSNLPTAHKPLSNILTTNNVTNCSAPTQPHDKPPSLNRFYDGLRKSYFSELGVKEPKVFIASAPSERFSVVNNAL